MTEKEKEWKFGAHIRIPNWDMDVNGLKLRKAENGMNQEWAEGRKERILTETLLPKMQHWHMLQR